MTLTHYENLRVRRPTQDGEWQGYKESSANPVKNYPQWVKVSFNDHDQQHGFMRGNVFHRPMYQLVLNGQSLPFFANYQDAIETKCSMVTMLNIDGERIEIILNGFEFLAIDKTVTPASATNQAYKAQGGSNE